MRTIYSVKSTRTNGGYGKRKPHTTKPESIKDFCGGPVVKNLSANAGDTSLIPGLGGSHMLQSN